MLLCALLIAGCSGSDGGGSDRAPRSAPDLETAAIRRGVIRDPESGVLTGLYARDTDRVCIVPQGMGYRIGVSVDYGDSIMCSGTGHANRAGETLHIELGGGSACSFDARFDDGHIIFPGKVPPGCEALCTRRASLAGLEVDPISVSRSEAAAMRDSRNRALCETGG
ncbi:hypothetical protein [Stakelama flava]|uniref:hypothetical protein n=1 Tax=Stakelama flava TaxID=2860338 RepID=UPI0031BB4046